MKYKKGQQSAGAGNATKIIIAILLVGIVAWIVLHSIGISITGIFEKATSLAGIKSGTADTSQDTSGCVIRRDYWQPEKASLGDTIKIIIEGEGDCDGKKVSVVVFESTLNKQKRAQEEIKILDKNDPFSGKVIKLDVKIEDPGQDYQLDAVYYMLNFGNYQKTSKLLITQ